MTIKTLASDNYSGVHPDIMQALMAANEGHAPSYGQDAYTEAAVKEFKRYFGADIEVYFVYNGTGANVSALAAGTQSFNAIICSDLAHINVDESTAPERFTGCKLITIPTKDGKIYPEEIDAKIIRQGDQHHPQAKLISISQSTEYGTVYSIEEIKALAATARRHNLLLHMDGSRIANAAVSLGKSFREFTRDAGVDMLSFGGTKNGMMFGEAVVFFNTALAAQFAFIRKQGMQLHSKMRYIGAQFTALLQNDLWYRNAAHANAMAHLLEHKLKAIPAIKITQAVDANSLFAIMPPSIIPLLQQTYFFYVWNDRTAEVRLMCSFDTTEEEIERFAEKLEEVLENAG